MPSRVCVPCHSPEPSTPDLLPDALAKHGADDPIPRSPLHRLLDLLVPCVISDPVGDPGEGRAHPPLSEGRLGDEHPGEGGRVAAEWREELGCAGFGNETIARRGREGGDGGARGREGRRGTSVDRRWSKCDLLDDQPGSGAAGQRDSIKRSNLGN